MTTHLTIEDVTQPIAEWALDYGVPASLIRSRLRRGWSEERAVTEPMIVRQGEKLPADAMVDESVATSSSGSIAFDGITLTITEWAHRIGVKPNTLRMRLANGWPLERALLLPTGCDGQRKPKCPYGRILEHDGKAMRVKEWAKHLGIRTDVINHRLRQGYPLALVLTRRNLRGRRPSTLH